MLVAFGGTPNCTTSGYNVEGDLYTSCTDVAMYIIPDTGAKVLSIWGTALTSIDHLGLCEWRYLTTLEIDTNIYLACKHIRIHEECGIAVRGQCTLNPVVTVPSAVTTPAVTTGESGREMTTTTGGEGVASLRIWSYLVPIASVVLGLTICVVTVSYVKRRDIREGVSYISAVYRTIMSELI